MSHPDPNNETDIRPIEIGEVWENPITRECATILELPHQNPDRRSVAELVARVGAKVVGEHRHPRIVERFTVLEAQLTVKRSGKTSILLQGEAAWWNAGRSEERRVGKGGSSGTVREVFVTIRV